jgi:ABC-type uncharacterized transport system substrate-binding protein
VKIDYRWPMGDVDKARKFAAELVALAPDVILAVSALSMTGVVTGDTHRADCVRGYLRSSRSRLCR